MDSASLQADGWINLDDEGFSERIGPMWTKLAGGARSVAFKVERYHRNRLKNAHGGMLMTLADNCMGFAAFEAASAPCATAQLQMQYISAAKVGDFVICQSEVLRRARDLIFIRAMLRVDDRIVASADGIWKILTIRPQG